MRPARVEPVISIVIPARNESAHIAGTLKAIEGARCSEVILVDGGSHDETRSVARSRGARVLVTPAGRARQMNAGAAVARGGVLLFLHADTCLPGGFDGQVLRALAQPGVAAGAFRLRFDGRVSPLLRIIERTANWRAQYLQLPFGDQGIFVPTGLFVEMGGFREIPIMEDVELIRRLKTRGRICIVPQYVATSSRRYEASGTLRRMVINKASFLGYCLGIPLERIVQWYDR